MKTENLKYFLKIIFLFIPLFWFKFMKPEQEKEDFQKHFRNQYNQYKDDLEKWEEIYNKIINFEFKEEVRRNLNEIVDSVSAEKIMKEFDLGYNNLKKDFLEYFVNSLKNVKIDPAKRVCYWAFPKFDKGWFRPFSYVRFWYQLQPYYHTILFETNSLTDMIKKLERYTKKYGKIDLLIISGHSTTHGFDFGIDLGKRKGAEIYKRNIDSLSLLQKFFNDDGEIILHSCSSAKIGKEIAEITKKKVFAPIYPAYFQYKLEFAEGGKVERVFYIPILKDEWGITYKELQMTECIIFSTK